MLKLFILSLTCIVFNLACGQNKPQKKFVTSDTSQKVRVTIDTSRITVLNLKTDWWLSKKLNTTKSFSLTNADIKTIDEIFRDCISKNNIDTSYFHYKRQYVPFIDKTGKKKIWINCFCSDLNDEFPNWKKSIVIVDDGGSCFFNIMINLVDNSFSNFEVNGDG